MNIKRLSVLCAILLLVFSGCIFSPKKKEGDPPDPKPVYRIPSTPEIVMDNYVKAYEHRDSTQIQLIYDDRYQGESTDNLDPNGPKITLYNKTDEVAHVAALYRKSSITKVTLDFGPILVRSTDLGDPTGWATVQISYISLEISDSPPPAPVAAAGEIMDFKFVPHTPDSSSPTDTTWKIIQWNETRN